MTNSDPIVRRNFLFLLARNYAKAMNVVAALKQADPVRRVAFMLFILSEESLRGGGIGVSQSDLAEFQLILAAAKSTPRSRPLRRAVTFAVATGQSR